MKRDVQKKITIILSLLLIFTIGYIIFLKCTEWSSAIKFEAYDQGVQQGYEQAILQIADQVATCQQVPLVIENQTINIFAVECLQQEEFSE